MRPRRQALGGEGMSLADLTLLAIGMAILCVILSIIAGDEP